MEGREATVHHGFFLGDMITEHKDIQIKDALMKDRHQSTSLKTPRGMTGSSRTKNTVTRPRLSSLPSQLNGPSYPLDWP